MHISPESKKRIQIVLAAAIAIAGVRAAYIIHERRAANARERQTKELPLNADYYVTPKKLHPYDLKSAREITKRPVWVKEGYRYTYYPYDAVRHHADFAHDAGTLLPLQQLQIKDVVTDVPRGAAGQREILAIFQQDGKTYAFPIGAVKGSDYTIYSDEMLYIQDPHELYKHWPADVWAAIDRHEVKPGMNELQADFAIGMGIPEKSADDSVKTVNYPNGGKPLTIVYREGKAAEIKPGTPA